MTQEEKDLLLKDLCARLPYDVKVEITYWASSEGAAIDSTLDLDILQDFIDSDGSTDIEPYLRPMSSMTEEETLRFEGFKMKTINSINVPNNIGLIDWLNAHHFDYRGLIPMGLALEAPEGMYKID